MTDDESSDRPASDGTPRVPRIFCAIDTQELGRATTLAASVADSVAGLKLGLEFFYSHGPKGLTEVSKAAGLPVFLDLKLHDIPNTVAGAARALCALKPAMVTVHAAGGADMVRAAVEAMDERAESLKAARPRVLGVTVLTSLDEAAAERLGFSGTIADLVVRLAEIAVEGGADGVVCSAAEAAAVRDRLGPDVDLVVPGVRPGWAAPNDQRRVMTPAAAARAGADVLVIGRPITDSRDPAAAADRIIAEMIADLSDDDDPEPGAADTADDAPPAETPQ